ncbi:CHAT domain-containing protein [Streptomyces diastatochromogenes]|nr:CHAT domain-containing protein [Streptomyces diastatochromogenes]
MPWVGRHRNTFPVGVRGGDAGDAGYADLPGVRAEAEAVAGSYPGSVPLVGADATHTALASALSRAAVAHFACHAVNVPEDPSRSGLVLADGTFSVAELSVHDLEGHAFLAYLSACDTARGGRVLTDEAITLCAGLVLAGFTHAFGTLWPVDDAAAAFSRAGSTRRWPGGSAGRGRGARQDPEPAGGVDLGRLARPPQPLGDADPLRRLSGRRRPPSSPRRPPLTCDAVSYGTTTIFRPTPAANCSSASG